jgi:HlyD family secretion protein
MTKIKDKSVKIKVKSVIRHVSLLVLFITLTAPAHSDENTAIGALGTLWPESGILHLSGTPGTSISSIEVKPEDSVLQGTVLARLSNRPLLEAELRAVQTEYEILVSDHTHNRRILRLVLDNNTVHLKRADMSLQKYLKLSLNAQVTTLREQKQNTLRDARHALNVSEAKIEQELAAFGLNKKKLELQIKTSQLSLRSSEIVAPFDGMVIDIPGKVGASSSTGVIVFADISKMMVKCEVYEGDIGKIKMGQKATISGKSLKDDIEGDVVQIGREIDVARRVATLWVSLKNSEDASQYIGMEVSVSINP